MLGEEGKMNKTFWVKNVSQTDVYLYDLNVKVPVRRLVNLLSKKLGLKTSQIEKSLKSGDLYKKRNKIQFLELLVDQPKTGTVELEPARYENLSSVEAVPDQVVITNVVYEELQSLGSDEFEVQLMESLDDQADSVPATVEYPVKSGFQFLEPVEELKYEDSPVEVVPEVLEVLPEILSELELDLNSKKKTKKTKK